ncbi:nitrous oxide reductase family maturation protein NosD [Pseudomonas sp. RTC3]|uniref:nitrous oxide reductase family maturation protein NosD n=1 Tax=Pseudomonas sp. 5C2 TaxID=3048588 RepID=UPI002AB50741|nr:nitrous oxide reductase family maturation protein NosD [Pseudomonas sp. 5C2]MDY7565241.1 nitrous oxide reductase family maturation protein NosD [Pseudomonas sp. 5C2]MEB0061712.1 nitrous oxide reductase family maturation protein NosD [Pseudomonas sp. RTC3]MEB0239621.1 nitrous oxide reductase family maturation protein NosD [Pseudomonas sp. 5C2]
MADIKENPVRGSRINAIALVLLMLSGTALAAVQPITALPLQADGDQRWHLPAGEYRGSFSVDQSMQIFCEPGAVFQGQGQGNGLIISAPEVRIEGCTFLDWGHDLTAMNAAVFIQPKASGAVIKGNRLHGQGFGIWVDGTQDVSLIDNRIQGDPLMRSQDRGNGIHLYAVHGARVIGNHVRDTRDGIYIDTSNGNLLQGNTLEDLRYGVHYMFANDNQLLGNTTRRTRTGYALMQSRKLTVIGNRSEQDQNYGILMNYITYSTLRDNFVTGVRDGSTGDSMISGAEGKALFIYNSLFNSIDHNHFEHSTVGIHLTAGSEDNRICENAFVGNQRQVKYVATRLQEWSVDGRGNYWSDYLGWDRNGDGLGDIAYEPNDNVDRLLWLYPQVRLLMNSPGIELLRWVQRAFPVMKSPGVLDSHPLMKPPTQTLTKEPTS